MIKFFRKIRQNLLSEGKTSKYFKYAIGEIILVVIGILIALQINNWNENRKQTKLVNGVLLEIYQNLKEDKKELELLIIKADNSMNKMFFLEENAATLPIDSLPKLIGNIIFITAWNANATGYNRFSNLSTEEIIPLKLRNTITNNYTYFLNEERNSTAALSISSANLLKEYLIKYGLPINNNVLSKKTKTNEVYNEIVKDLKFYGLLRNHRYNYEVQQYGFNEHLVEVKDMIKQLESYLKSYNND
jgi:hypothetical protein